MDTKRIYKDEYGKPYTKNTSSKWWWTCYGCQKEIDTYQGIVYIFGELQGNWLCEECYPKFYETFKDWHSHYRYVKKGEKAIWFNNIPKFHISQTAEIICKAWRDDNDYYGDELGYSTELMYGRND